MPNKKFEDKANSLDKDLLVKTFMQRELVKRYLEKKLGPGYTEEDKHDFEVEWAKKSADKFREIFEERKEEFFKVYDSKDADALELLIDSVIKGWDAK